MATFELTSAQLNFIETFGYIHFPGLLNDRADEIIDAFEQVFLDLNVEHQRTQRTSISPFLGQSEYLSSLLDDDRIDGIFSSLLGDDYSHLGSDGSFFVNETQWHSDTPWEGSVNHYKMALYLDPLTASTGALRVIAGSHKYGDAYANTLQESIEKLETVYGLDGPSVPAVAIESQPGDVLLFNQGIKHASFGGSTQRRMIAINATYRSVMQELLAQPGAMDWCARQGKGQLYGEKMLATASPRRLVHLAPVLALAPDGRWPVKKAIKVIPAEKTR